MHLVRLVHDVDVGDFPAFEPQQVVVLVLHHLSGLLLVRAADVSERAVQRLQRNRQVEFGVLDDEVEQSLVEAEGRMEEVPLNELVALTSLVEKEQAASVKNGVAQQNRIDLLNAVSWWELSDVVPLELTLVLFSPLVVQN